MGIKFRERYEGGGMANIKRIMILVCFMLLTGTISGEQKTSDIFIKEPVWDFGAIEQHTKITHEFLVHNRGNADLIIDRVRSG